MVKLLLALGLDKSDTGPYVMLRQNRGHLVGGPGMGGWRLQPLAVLRISAIVDAHFSLIVDGKAVPGRTCRGGMQVLGLNVAQSSTIRLKRSAVARSRGPGRAATWCP